METFITLSSDFNPYLFGISVAIAVVILFFTIAGYKKSRRRSERVWLILIRFLALALIIFMLQNPVIKKDKVLSSKNIIPVIIDNSISMNFMTKYERGKSWIKANAGFFDSLQENHKIIFFDISGKVMENPLKNESVLEPRVQSTDIVSAIEKAASDFNRNDLAGVIVVSDGIDNGILSKGVKEDGVLDEELLRRLHALDAPVHTFEVTAPSLVRDLFIERVDYPPFTFVKNFTSIRVYIGISGFENQKVKVVLNEEGVRVAEKEVTLDQEVLKEGIEMEFLPLMTGPRFFDVFIYPLDNEASERNNHFPFFMDILRERIRVLHLAGRPSWDVRFMREFLMHHNNVDLVSFFILEHSSGLEYDSDDGKVLIPFPAEKLFTEELRGFDLLVVQDYLPELFNARRYGQEIEKFVAEGGGLLVMGGRNMTGAALKDFLGDLLPLKFETGTSTAIFIADYIKAEIDPNTTGHPILSMPDGERVLHALIEKAPRLEGLLASRGLESWGAVIFRDAASKYPVLVAGEKGSGRTAFFATDSFWKWKFTANMHKEPSRLFDLLMTNLLNYLTGGETYSSLKISVANRELFTGGKNNVLIKLNREGVGKVEVDCSFSLILPGKPLDFMKFRHETIEGNEGRIEVVPEISGVYKIEVRAEINDEKAYDSNRFLASDNAAELRLGPSLLRHISDATGGKNLTVDYVNPPLYFKEPVKYHVATLWVWEVWNFWGIFLVIVMLLTAEWYLRRRIGLS